MTHPDVSFGGSIPSAYDQALGPMFFEPYAVDLIKRLDGAPKNVLEIAAGTGIVTRHLLQSLGSDSHLIVTDVNEAMLAVARGKIGDDPRVEWRVVDASALPFADQAFDTVVCQFALMFFPDTLDALKEMRRTLAPSGTLLFNVWGALGDNPIAALAQETIASFFHTDPPQFFTIPFGLSDPGPIGDMLTEAGFSSFDYDVVDKEGRSASVELAARGLVFGNPGLNEILQRGTVDPTVIMHAVAARLLQEGGTNPMRLPMRAVVFKATR